MRNLLFILAALALCLLSLGKSHAQCGPGGCGPASAPAVHTPVYSWIYAGNDYRQVQLLRNGVQVGTYWYTDQSFYLYDARTGKWSGDPTTVFQLLEARQIPPVPDRVEHKSCPCGPDCKCTPCNCGKAAGQVPPENNMGIIIDEIDFSKPRCRVSDGKGGTRDISADDAKAALGRGELEDDRNKYRISIVGGSEELRRMVLNDLATSPQLSWLRDRSLVHTYPDSMHHHLESFKLERDRNFQQSGFMICLQSPPDSQNNARRLHCQYDYDDGADGLSVGAKRRIDPDFDPNVDVDGRKTNPLSGVAAVLMALPGWAYLIAGGFVAALIVRKG